MLPRMSILDHVLTEPPDPGPIADLAAWWTLHRAIRARWSSRLDRSVAGGFAADRVGWAFASGYQEALGALVPGLDDDAVAALCVTEKGGNTPRAIEARLSAEGDGFVLEGEKRWTTLGTASTTLFVAARIDGPGASRPELRVVRVASGAPGMTLTPMRDAPFVPEIPHASVSLRGVRIAASDVLPGDGYDCYVKPFRTVEDLHVNAAMLGHAVRVLRASPDAAAREAVEDALASIAALAALASDDATTAGAHLALAGAIRGVLRVLEELDRRAAGREDDEAVRWRRDRALVHVAAGARARRTERAWGG
jgi:alkylation response protein AidB-like acyl-CoA dehydrogenase